MLKLVCDPYDACRTIVMTGEVGENTIIPRHLPPKVVRLEAEKSDKQTMREFLNRKMERTHR